MGVEIRGQIEKVNGKDLSYTEFVERYLANNQPVVLTGLMDNWRACKDWVFDNGEPNLKFFSTHFGNSKVQVAHCGTREFMDQKRLEMTVSEFIDHWIDGEECDNTSKSSQEGNIKAVLYLKDWHFVKVHTLKHQWFDSVIAISVDSQEYPDYVAYKTPLLFWDDWLNLYLDHHRMHNDSYTGQENDEISCSDYLFVYMGAKGHIVGQSANVCGKKMWLFLPPSQCHFVFDRDFKSCAYNIFDDVSETKFPGFKRAIWLECTQEKNEIIFVPSGWYHQVHNLAKEYIEDIREICDDFEGLCQRNLAANTGMNLSDLFIFLSNFFLANMLQLYCPLRENGIQVWSSSRMAKHLAFNLASIRGTALKMMDMDGVAGIDGFLDLMETLDDPKFIRLCIDVGRTYGMIHEEQTWSYPEKAWVVEYMDYSFQISNVEDLVKSIDYFVAKLSSILSVENILGSGLNGL